MGNKPTIKMVAERAGVSRGTVDRVINGRAYVRDEVRERVLHAMREIGYMPIHLAQAKALGLAPDAQPVTLGVLLPDWSGHFLREVGQGIEKARNSLSDYSVTVAVEQCQTEIPEECVEKLDALCARGVQGIALCAKNHPAIGARINQLAEQGIPVITFNSDIPESRRVCFVGQDVVRSGRVAGDLMAKCISERGRILAAVGNLEFDGHKQRLQGFLDRMEECGFARDKITVIQTYNDYGLSYTRVGEALARLPELAGIYMANHSVTGCAEAVRAAGKQGKIRVVSHDVTEGTRRLMQTGAVDFTIAQDLHRQGERPLMLLFGMLCKNNMPKETTEHLSLQIVCSQNLDFV